VLELPVGLLYAERPLPLGALPLSLKEAHGLEQVLVVDFPWHGAAAVALEPGCRLLAGELGPDPRHTSEQGDQCLRSDVALALSVYVFADLEQLRCLLL